MEEAQRPDDAAATQPPSDLVATLRRACDVLAAVAQRDDVPSARLAQVSRGLVTATAFLQVAEQQPIGALGVDFVAAARWLGDYYDHCATQVKDQAKPLLFGGNGRALGQGPTAAQLGNVGDALVATAQMWREVAEAAQRPGYYDMLARYEAWMQSSGEPDADVLEYFGGIAPEQPTYHGVVRIWTAVTAALATSVTSGQLRGGRQEVVVMTQLMVATAREAAVMAEAMGREAQEPNASDCKYRGTTNQRACAEEGCGFCRAAERHGDEAAS